MLDVQVRPCACCEDACPLAPVVITHPVGTGVQALYDAFSTTSDPKAALLAYEKARVSIAEKVVLNNRKMGPTRLLKMLDDACGDKSKAEQEAWVASQAAELEKFSTGYQAMTGNKKVKSRL